MYASHFGLDDEPFRLTPDPSRLYLGVEHREAVAALRYGVLGRRGFVLLVGEVGTGKTTIVYDLLASLHGGVRAAYVNFTYQPFSGLLTDALAQLGLDVGVDASTARMVRLFNEHLMQQAETDSTTAIIIDEAQHLSDEAFEQLRLLSNCETHREKLVQIVLVGQPELEERLAKPELRQIRERIAVRAALHPLPRAEMRRYLDHRVCAAGGTRLERLFTERAIRTLVAESGGIPRRANIVCHNALLFAYGRGLARVDRAAAMEAVTEFRRGRTHGTTPSLAWRIAAGMAAIAMLGTGAWWLRREAEVARAAVSPAVASAVAAAAAPAPVVIGITEAPAEVLREEPSPAVGDMPTPTGEVPREEPSPVVDDMPKPKPAAASESPSAAWENRPTPIVTIAVPAGATLGELAYRVYGRELGGRTLPELFDEIQRLNPGLHDVGFIMAGERLHFPVFASSPHPQG